MELFFKKYPALNSEGVPILLLHGAFGSLNNWGGVAKKLSLNHDVYALDLRNHGDSPHDINMSYIDMSNDIYDFLKQHRIEKAYIVGHSMGGKVAMQVALRFPELVSKLTIVDIAPKEYPLTYGNFIEAFDMISEATLTSRGAANKLIEEKIPERKERIFVLGNLVKKGDIFTWKINIETIKKNYPIISLWVEHETKFSAPVLFVLSDQSGFVTKEDINQIQRLFPNSRFETIEDSSHWIHIDQEKKFVEAVGNFLQRSA